MAKRTFAYLTILCLISMGLQARPLREVIGEELQRLHLNQKILTLSNCDITHITDGEMEQLVRSYPDLEQLYLVGNRLTSLPTSIGEFPRLAELHLERNMLTEVPIGIANLYSLEVLDLSHNRLLALPLWINNLQNLRKLNLADNYLTRLPDEVAYLTGLGELILDNNCLNQAHINLLSCAMQGRTMIHTGTQRQRDEFGLTCPICLAPIVAGHGSPDVVVSCCDTHYHQACLNQWLARKPTCPQCRAIIGRKQRRDSMDSGPISIYDRLFLSNCNIL